MDGTPYKDLMIDVPLARLKLSSKIEFFPNRNSGSTWEFNEFDSSKGETPSFPIPDWQNKWIADDSITVTCSSKSISLSN